MRRFVLLAMAIGLGACATAPKQASGPIDDTSLSLIPMPAQVQRLPGHFQVSAATKIVVAPGDTQARRVAAQLQGWVRLSRGMTLDIVEGKAASGAIALVTEAAIRGREAYTLDVGTNGVRIAANDETGLFYGAVTYWQLLTDPAAHSGVPAVHIVDAPRFEWRGLPAVELRADAGVLVARWVDKPLRSPAWKEKRLASSADVRGFAEEVKRCLRRWDDED